MDETITVIVPCRNEINNVPRLMAMLKAQTRQPDEVLVVDGMSRDGTREALQASDAARRGLRILDNPRGDVPNALNIGLAAASSTLIARMDMHARYDPTYLEVVGGFLGAHPEIAGAGGAMSTQGSGQSGKAIAATLRRPIGMGGARHRTGGSAGPVQHAFSATYRRTALLAAGGWDTRLKANEDFEADIRVAQASGPIWLVPDATSTWFVRETLPALSRQMYRYGYYKGLTMYLHPDSVSLRQIVPPALVAATVASIAVSVRKPIALSVPIVYGLASAFAGARSARADGADGMRGALVPATVHLSWGLGLIIGLARFAPKPAHAKLGSR
jgi:succinoglycan biosynthesis protein ExoA